MNNKELLVKGAMEYGVSLSEHQCLQFEKYSSLLREWNEKMNLTAITDEKEIVIKHFLDSLSISPCLPKGKMSLMDVGSGAGFPGIPLKIAKPDIEITLLDSLGKRVRFLNEVLENIGVKEKYSCVHLRAEDAGQDSSYREKFDVCTARAVARLNVLLEYCLPLVKPGGIFIAMKGIDKGEIDESKRALELLCGEIIDVKNFDLFVGEVKRTVIIIRKNRHLSPVYPRKADKIIKRPLI